MSQTVLESIDEDKSSASYDVCVNSLAHLMPKHIAIVMDGNGRWAQQRALPRVAGHRAGVAAAKATIKHCLELKISVLTLFAFSSENWARPRSEVRFLMNLFSTVLQRETRDLHRNNIRLRVIGDRQSLDDKLVRSIDYAEATTANNTGMFVVIALNYGGRWDITQAARLLALDVQAGIVRPDQITEQLFHRFTALSDLPPPDLFIRTSGEMRVSNFLTWQMVYTEMVFTKAHWPDFDKQRLCAALIAYSKRQRRFGQIDANLQQS